VRFLTKTFGRFRKVKFIIFIVRGIGSVTQDRPDRSSTALGS
jgi:hypothetical protein